MKPGFFKVTLRPKEYLELCRELEAADARGVRVEVDFKRLTYTVSGFVEATPLERTEQISLI